MTCFTQKKLSMSRPSIWYKLWVSGQNGEFLAIFFPRGTSLVNRAQKRLILPIFWCGLRVLITKNLIFFSKISKLKWSAYCSSSFCYQLKVDRQRGSVMAQNLLCLTDFVIWGDTLCSFLGEYCLSEKKYIKKIKNAMNCPKWFSFVVKMSYATRIFS